MMNRVRGYTRCAPFRLGAVVLLAAAAHAVRAADLRVYSVKFSSDGSKILSAGSARLPSRRTENTSPPVGRRSGSQATSARALERTSKGSTTSAPGTSRRAVKWAGLTRTIISLNRLIFLPMDQRSFPVRSTTR